MDMEQGKYKGYSVITSAEQDEVTRLWNGRYRILDNDGMVAYESFTTSVNDEAEAQKMADTEARAWIDNEPEKLHQER
jgi:hypothetical protein